MCVCVGGCVVKSSSWRGSQAGELKGNTVVLIFRNAACQSPGLAGTKPKYLAHPSSCACSLSSSSLQRATATLLLPNSAPHPLKWESPRLHFLWRSASTLLPPQHSCPGVAVAGRLSQLAGQNSSVTSPELLENWTLPRTPGTRIRKRTKCIRPLVAMQSLTQTQLPRCSWVKIHAERRRCTGSYDDSVQFLDDFFGGSQLCF